MKISKWTIIYLIQALRGAECEIIKKMFEGLLSLNKSKEINLIICLNITVSGLKKLQPDYNPISENTTTTVFYNLESFISSKKEHKNKLSLMFEDTFFDLRKVEDLTSFFKNQVILNLKAEKYILITWDHGSAYGIFKQENSARLNSYTYALSNYSKKISTPFTSKFTKKWLNLSEHEDNSTDMLTAYNLNCALKDSFGKTKIDVLIMMNCYMQLFDTGYSLSKQVNYLVAPETLLHNMSPYNFHEIVNCLFKKPHLQGSDIAKLTVSTVKNMYRQYAVNEEFYGTAVFANSLINYDNLAKTIDGISDSLIKEISTNFLKIKAARDLCGDIPATGSGLIDYLNFIRNISKQLGFFWEISNRLRLFFLIKKTIKKKYVDRIFSITKVSSPVKPQGFSVCFPQTPPDDSIDNGFYDTFINENSSKASPFSLYHKWDNFVALYLKYVNNEIKNDSN